MAGYRDRVIRIPFPELSEDPENDPQWVIIRNPKLLPQEEMASFGGAADAYEPVTDPQTGQPVLDEETGRPKLKVKDQAAATQGLRRMVARLVVAARLYDASDLGEFDPETGEPAGDQPMMPPTPWPPEVAAKLPLLVLERISGEFSDAANPPKPPSGNTLSGSSGSTSPSATGPGAEGQSPPRLSTSS